MDLDKKTLEERLELLAKRVQHLLPEGQLSCIQLVGSSVFILREETTRPITHDVDFLSCDKTLRTVLPDFPEFNCRASIFEEHLPYNWEDRAEVINPGNGSLYVVLPSLEDMVVMKLYTYYRRGQDRVDVTSPAVLNKVDWELLDHLVFDRDEAWSSLCCSNNFRDLLTAYKEYRTEYGPSWPPKEGDYYYDPKLCRVPSELLPSAYPNQEQELSDIE